MSFLPPFLTKSDTASLRLAIIGGRLEDDNRAIYREMRRLSNGRVLIFPTASSEPEEIGPETLVAFQTHGFQAEIANLTAENALRTAHDPALIQKIGAYGSVYFTGGDQANILNALVQDGEETPVLRAIRASLRSGGMLAGSSAGAAMMSSQMILGGTSFEAMAHGVTEDPEQPGIMLGPGLGFFPHGLVDQHFIKRGRIGRLVVAMAQGGHRRGFGVDENTALLVEGPQARVCGEYGVFFVDMEKAVVDVQQRHFDEVRLTYLDDGDVIDLRTFKTRPGETKRRVRRSEVAYRAPARSQRNAFGAYAIYDLVARLVLGDQQAYASDKLMSLDSKSGVCALIEVARVKGRSRCLISTPTEGLRVTAVNMRASLKSDKMSIDSLTDREVRSARAYGMDLNERSRIILLGSSPLYHQPAQQKELVDLLEGPVGVFAAASAEARRTAEEHVEFFVKNGVEAIDLGVTLDTVDYAAKDIDALNRIASMRSIFLCGGNQIRLVETLLHRGEESAVLQAIASAYAQGAAVIASSGAASALSGVMIAGGTTSEALRYGVSSNTGHQGIAIQEGVGLFPTGIADQNIITARRLGRLIVACVEENERFGIGVCEESGVVAIKSGRELKALGRYGFVQVETDPVKTAPVGDRFMARDIRVRIFAPGDIVNLHSGHVQRRPPPTHTVEAFDRLLNDLKRESSELDVAERSGRDPSARHSVKLRIRREDDVTAMIDLEAAAEEHD
jgi:cyanophycinase